MKVTIKHRVRSELARLEERVSRAKMRLTGHIWTVFPYGVAAAMTPPKFGGMRFDAQANDPVRGPVPITGTLHRAKADSRRLVIVMHGITATPKDVYVRQMVRALSADGNDVLSLALRGATCVGSDHYHAGLIDDLTAIFADPRCAHYDDIFVIGYSLGGQIALKFGLTSEDPRLRGIVGLCAPISMKASQDALDAPNMTGYRLAILKILKWKYAQLAKNGHREGRPVMTSPDTLKAIDSFYQWDQEIVCNRYGYESVEAYYEAVSVGPRLNSLKVPNLLIFGKEDPIVPFEAIKPLVQAAGPMSEVHVLSPGGHLGFPVKAELAQGGKVGIHHQVTTWIRNH